MYMFWAHSKITNTARGTLRMSGNESSVQQRYPKFFDSSTGEYLPLNVVLQSHISTCGKCQETLEKKPQGLGQLSRLCFEYQDLIQDWSIIEGELNNIVAHDEYGNEAPRAAYPGKENPYR